MSTIVDVYTQLDSGEINGRVDVTLEDGSLVVPQFLAEPLSMSCD